MCVPIMDNVSQPPGAKRILIMEDEDALANALQLKLGNAGFDITVTQDGQQGLEKARTNNYDLVMLDLILPVVDGFSVLERLQKSGNKTPVFVLTNLSQDEDIMKAKGLGADEFMVKADTQLSQIESNIKQFLATK